MPKSILLLLIGNFVDCHTIVQMNGRNLEGRDTNLTFGYYSKVGAWNNAESGGQVYPFDECLVFAGLEPKNPDYLGAEVELHMG